MKTRNAEAPKSKKTPTTTTKSPALKKTTPKSSKSPALKETTPKSSKSPAVIANPAEETAVKPAKKAAKAKPSTLAPPEAEKVEDPVPKNEDPPTEVEAEIKEDTKVEPMVEMEIKEDAKAEPTVEMEIKEDAKAEPTVEIKIKEDAKVDPTVEVEIKEDAKAEPTVEMEIKEDAKLEPTEEAAEQQAGDEEVVAEEGGDVGEGAEQNEDEEEAAVLVVEEEQTEISNMANARKIKKELEVFVGGLDRDAVEEDLKKVFEKVGEVVEIRLHKDFATNKNKGFAFVKFANKEQVAKAHAELKNPVIRGKRCGIAPIEDNDTLFLGNICNTWTKEAIKRKLKDYGIDNVESITLVADTKIEGFSRGFAFLEFPCHTDAMLAYKRLQKPDVIFGHPERTAKVAFAEPIREPEPEVMAQIKSVFVDGMPPYWDEDHVKEHFKGYGEIERVVLARNLSSAKRKDFGFVNFTTHEAAVACIEGVNNTELGDGKSKTRAKARLANPQPKIQAVKGGMSGGFLIGHTGIGTYSRFGRGFPRGRFFPGRAAFQRGRGLNLHGRGRGGRFPFVPDNMESSYSEFRGRRPFGVRGGRAAASARGGAFNRGSGRAFPPRRQSFAPEVDYGTPYNARPVGEDPYLYDEDSYLYGSGGHGVKRPFDMMERDPGYLELGSRLRPRYDHLDSVIDRYRGTLGTSGGLYSRDFYGSGYGGSTYSSLYRDEQTGRGYY